MSGFPQARAPWGLPGARAATRYVGATTSGAPVSGTFKKGDFNIGQDGSLQVCTVAGSPGTWVAVGFSGAYTGNITATGDITARLGTAPETKIGAIGPASESGVMFGSAGDTKLYRTAAGTLTTSHVNAGYLTAYAGSVVQVYMGGGSKSQVVFGLAEDTSLYRDAANTLKTDDTFVAPSVVATTGVFIAGASFGFDLNGTNAAFSGNVVSNYNSVAAQTYIGAVGPGGEGGLLLGNALDTVLYRIAANTLATDDSLKLVAAASRLIFGHASQEQSTVGAAGGAAAVPASPTKYLKVIDSAGAELVVPAFAAV